MMPPGNRARNNRSTNSCERPCRLCVNTVKWFPVVFIMAIVSWSYYSYVVLLCLETVTNNVELVVYLICYHFFFFIFIWSYWQTIFTESAIVPPKFRMPYQELEKIEATDDEALQRQIVQRFANTLPVVTKTVTGGVRFCDVCHHVKPDRAHHCSVCGKCILKMDHHCPWVNNCVSFTNYKFFILFLAYAFLYCIYVTLTTLQYFIQFWRGDAKSTTTGKFNIVFLFFVAIMFAFSLAWLFAYHIYLILNNRTTLEAFRAPVFATGPDRNGFNLGLRRNFREVFGDDQLKWFLPMSTSRGDGLHFEVRPNQPNYYSMGSTENNSLGDGISYPQREVAEDMAGLLENCEDPEIHHASESVSGTTLTLNPTIAI